MSMRAGGSLLDTISTFRYILYEKEKRKSTETHEILFKTLSILQEFMQSTVHNVLSSSSSDGSGGSSAA